MRLAPVELRACSTGGFDVHVPPALYTAHLEWPLVPAVRGADRVMAGDIARSGNRSLSRSRASRRLSMSTGIAPPTRRAFPSVPKIVVTYHAYRGSPWANDR